jgi:peptidoglycan hydrolase CwlO-like protein
MPSRNRVDDLEDEVDELKATVQGLTEELVEAHERIRQVERALAGGSDAARDAARVAAAEAAADIEASIRESPREVAEAAASADPGPGPASEPGDSATTEGDKGQQAEGGDDAEGDVDDIIVA